MNRCIQDEPRHTVIMTGCILGLIPSKGQRETSIRRSAFRTAADPFLLFLLYGLAATSLAGCRDFAKWPGPHRLKPPLLGVEESYHESPPVVVDKSGYKTALVAPFDPGSDQWAPEDVARLEESVVAAIGFDPGSVLDGHPYVEGILEKLRRAQNLARQYVNEGRIKRRPLWFVTLRADRTSQRVGFTVFPGWKDEFLMATPEGAYERRKAFLEGLGWQITFNPRWRDGFKAGFPLHASGYCAIDEMTKEIRVKHVVTDVRNPEYRAYVIRWLEFLRSEYDLDGIGVGVKRGWHSGHSSWPVVPETDARGRYNALLMPTQYRDDEFEDGVNELMRQIHRAGFLLVSGVTVPLRWEDPFDWLAPDVKDMHMGWTSSIGARRGDLVEIRRFSSETPGS